MADNEVIRSAAIAWIEQNTTFDVSIDPLPATVEMFIEKYGEIMGLRAGVSSESISGLSQSFNGDSILLLKQYAQELIGYEYMKSDVQFIPSEKRWDVKYEY
jgi:hypothetical protein